MILLIEDNAGDILLFQKALAATPSQCTVARDAEQGIELLRQRGEDFNVVLVDLRLPGLDGWEVLEFLRDHPQIRVTPVVLTSSGNRQDRQRAEDLQVAHYWIKPDDFAAFKKIGQAAAALDQPSE